MGTLLSPAGRGAAGGKKRRAFWGQRMHHKLVRGLGLVATGPFEAYVDETVFATKPRNHEMRDSNESSTHQAWRDFASSIVLYLPSLGGTVRFGFEFLAAARISSLARWTIRQTDAQTRVMWLAME